MNIRDRNLLVSAAGFVLGGIFILSDKASITSNVIGYAGSDHALASVVGLIMVVGSAAFFMLALHMGELKLEKLVRENPKNHEELKPRMDKQEMEEKYETEKLRPAHAIEENNK